ncbi:MULTISPECIES: DUF4227 family protein [Oceanobacillus]|uniref:DUF4227 family protein n=1 Tax=Oceanobacillus kimchii TaxID=746691 RepID=A0ABQ5TJ63_9BACI|nr:MULTISPECIES: DUF4227 family protein [Oceanobacillus]MBT2598402.1 YqzK family protein [Oceanobacillus sp. ISL-74]MBT2651320.1 YqzK family protein [Oceanobacillus sp. ISL-73]MCT1575979.1 YqzK family protein [Oceanobacillus kimchii]MCT2135616.1 YqzK family protein [Oceanobacillus kimchii]GLO66500.1 hypothetical protein MACH08_22840 [Oceanobacillus kimchii]
MRKLIIDMIKIFLLFMISACIFYYALQLMHKEYLYIHRFDPPQGPAVKVFQENNGLFDLLPLNFLGDE